MPEDEDATEVEQSAGWGGRRGRRSALQEEEPASVGRAGRSLRNRKSPSPVQETKVERCQTRSSSRSPSPKPNRTSKADRTDTKMTLSSQSNSDMNRNRRKQEDSDFIKVQSNVSEDEVQLETKPSPKKRKRYQEEEEEDDIFSSVPSRRKKSKAAAAATMADTEKVEPRQNRNGHDVVEDNPDGPMTETLGDVKHEASQISSKHEVILDSDVRIWEIHKA